MDIVILFIIAAFWGLVGVLVKISALMVDSYTITFLRFFFGIVFLGVLLLAKDKKITVHWRSRWIWLGAIGKCTNYIFENLGISMGNAYGNIIIMPLYTMFLILISVLYLKEKMPAKNWAATGLCLAGVFLISWNGLSLEILFQTNLATTLLFALSAAGVAIHLMSQKILIQSMDSGNMNFSVFLWCSLITAAPLPFTFEWPGTFNIWSLLSLTALGLITGISFYLYANTLKKTPFLIAVIISNSSVLFTLLWSWVFLNETITLYIIAGAVIFLAGIIILNILEGVDLRRLITFSSEQN